MATVQTLSRLNRIASGKEKTLVLDFVNDQESVQADFQDYYQATMLDKGIDRQKLYNLKYEIERTHVFRDEDVNLFTKMFVFKKSKADHISSFSEQLVQQNFLPLSDDDKTKFRKQVKSYVRQYAFISQIITYVNVELEKFYLFTKLFSKYLPEVTEMVDMDKYVVQEKENGSILLNTDNQVRQNSSTDRHDGKSIYPEEQ
ncbi:hypothetical protein CSA56_06975 [candidate division KSB3 bacterium]|uniref:Uncharacterized protein n=1 Tax=candidate division KSB3 bacterium TaxID=2044937 RepID=A0A2G6KIT5_9BACT|nr:MAG: hypothetical protein CSA56_06975 [candidate division KSB3 bacterium]